MGHQVDRFKVQVWLRLFQSVKHAFIKGIQAHYTSNQHIDSSSIM